MNTEELKSNPPKEIPMDQYWNLNEALGLCHSVEQVCSKLGFHVALTGGLLYRGGVRKDCDLMFYPHNGADPDLESLWPALESKAGLYRTKANPLNLDPGQPPSTNRCIKAEYQGKRVDILFPYGIDALEGHITSPAYDPYYMLATQGPIGWRANTSSNTSSALGATHPNGMLTAEALPPRLTTRDVIANAEAERARLWAPTQGAARAVFQEAARRAIAGNTDAAAPLGGGPQPPPRPQLIANAHEAARVVREAERARDGGGDENPY